LLIYNGDIVVGKDSDNAETKSKAALKAEALKKISTTEVTVNEQLDYYQDPAWKSEMMKFCVASMNNQQAGLDVEISDIQKLYATHLINQDKEKSLWNKVNASEDRLSLLQSAAQNNAVPALMLVERYNERLEREGRSREKLDIKSLESSTKIQHFSSELEKELDKISETLAEFQTKPSAAIKTKKSFIAKKTEKSFEPK